MGRMFMFIYVLLHIVSANVLTQIGRFYIENIGFPGAENIAVDTTNNRIFTADGVDIGVKIISFDIASGETTFELEKSIYFNEVFTTTNLSDVTSIYYSPKQYVIASVVPDEPAIDYGYLAFINTTTLSIFHTMELEYCYLPDHISMTHDGAQIIVSCEGEPDDNEIETPSSNPPGTMCIVDVSSTNPNEWTAQSVNFEDFNDGGTKAEMAENLYIPHVTELFSINAEPEYSVVDGEDKYAYIALQEQNAIGVLDMEQMEISAIYSLGYHDFSKYPLDASDKDNMIKMRTYPNLLGMRNPDSIDYMLSNANRHYIFTANEGDSKKFDESRVKKLTLSSSAFAGHNVSELQEDESLGRLKVSNLIGQNDDGEFETLYTFGSRDFTIYEVLFDADGGGAPTGINLVYSSLDIFENVTAAVLGDEGFNSDYFNPSFDERSDAKGPEPESIVVGQCANGNKFVFVGMERSGGIFVFDVTNLDEGNVEFVQYFNNQNYSIEFEEDVRSPASAGDIGPEQLRFIDESVYGEALLFVAYPESSSVAVYSVDCGEVELVDDDNDDEEKGNDNDSGLVHPSWVVFVILSAFVYTF